MLRFEKWKEIIVKEEDFDRKRIMTKISQKVEKEVEQIEKMFSRQRFDSEKKKIKIVKNAEKVQKVASLSSRKRTFNKSRITDLWKDQLNEKKFLNKLKSV